MGREQARLLGHYLQSQGISPDAVYSGTFNRQRLTAEIACESLLGPEQEGRKVDIIWHRFTRHSPTASPKRAKSLHATWQRCSGN
jgi:broad specificity phosphatase PhoE